MSFRAECPECGSGFTVEDQFAGRSGKCAKCQYKFVIKRPTVIPQPAKTMSPPATKSAADSWKDDAIGEDEPKPTVPRGGRVAVNDFDNQTPLARNFATLKLFAISYGILAVIVLLISLFAGVIAVVSGSPEGFLIIGGGVSLCLSLLLGKETIILALAIEENTRITAEVVRAKL